MSALQVAKHPIATPGPATAYTPPPSRHATLPGVASGVMGGITMTGSLPYNYPPYMTPTMGARDMSSIDQSSGYPTPRPGTAASDLDTSYCMGSPQISGNPFKSFPKPHSSPKMKLRLPYFLSWCFDYLVLHYHLHARGMLISVIVCFSF